MTNGNEIIKIQPKYTKKYKCPYCEKRLERNKLITHVDRTHEDMIPEGYSSTRVIFNLINKKTNGSCVICRRETPWDESKARYDRICNRKTCKEAYIKQTADRLYKKHGKTKEDFLNDPEFQNKMLQNRSISGKYKFQDGGVLSYVGSYEKAFLSFMDNFFHIKSSDLTAPGPVIDYQFNGKTHQWITDYYYEPYNLVFDIKDGGDNPNTRNMEEYRKKQLAKEKAIKDQKQYNYIRLTDNRFDQMIQLMLELKENLMEAPHQTVRTIHITRINEVNNILDYKETAEMARKKLLLLRQQNRMLFCRMIDIHTDDNEWKFAIYKITKETDIDELRHFIAFINQIIHSSIYVGSIEIPAELEVGKSGILGIKIEENDNISNIYINESDIEYFAKYIL
ncbi:MAG: hypothetical protein PHC62_00600 [Candidatus Izemoplasmatales bacterium]|nr:hypothetical protein [Candidatus Izemoplasmatales bacterium]